MIAKRLFSFFIFITFLNIIFAQEYINKSIQHDGLTRTYSIYVPESYDGTADFPLLFNFHGGNDLASGWQVVSDMRPLADTANIIIVYPQARPDPSDGNSLNWLPKTAGTFDDVPFISAIIDEIDLDYRLDQKRIYACGYSLGGEFSFELACKLSNRIAAIGVVARTMQANPNSYCAPVHSTGVLTILGTDDFVSPYEGIVFNGIEFYISALETHEYWANQNDCELTPTMSNASPSVERFTWSTTSGCSFVENLKVLGGGHDWPGSFGNMTINSNSEIWQFVSKYDINGLIECTTTSTSESKSSQENYLVYPNPIHSQLRVEMEVAKEKEFRIYSTSGKLLLSGMLDSNINEINLSSLSPNVYVLKIDKLAFKLIKSE